MSTIKTNTLVCVFVSNVAPEMNDKISHPRDASSHACMHASQVPLFESCPAWLTRMRLKLLDEMDCASTVAVSGFEA